MKRMKKIYDDDNEVYDNDGYDHVYKYILW